MSNSNVEKDVRMDVMNSLLNTPHRKVEEIVVLHKEYIAADATFYGHLAAWYLENGDIRDHKEVFIATLFQSELEQHREAAFAMLVSLPLFQVARTVSHMRKFFGKKVPRTARTAIKDYLHAFERNEYRFDMTAVRSRKAMKGLYALFHVKCGKRASEILFDEKFPAGSLPYYTRMLSAKGLTDADRARLIVENSIPFVTAMDSLPNITPVTLAALIDSMSPQEVVNCMAQLKRRGAMDDADMRKMIHAKIDKVSKDKRASGTKAAVAADAVGLDVETRKKLEKATDNTLKAKGTIRRPTAIFVDRSGSLHVAIAVGMQVASTVSGVCESDLYVYAFNDVAMEIESPGRGATDWTKAFKGLTASGSTGIGSCFAALQRHKRVVEQVVIITDEGENRNPMSDDAYKEYAKAMGVSPTVTIIQVGSACDSCQKRLRSVGAQVDVLKFDGDYYSLTNLVSMLSRPSKLDFMMEVAETPLPTKKDAVLRLERLSGKGRKGHVEVDGAEPEPEPEGEAKCSTSGTTSSRSTSKSKSPRPRRKTK
jgi:hypothetical protein